ncbi:MAG: hypothetical protein AAF492_08760, partial [Verrucomicrobiota bacterium]
MIRSTAPNGIKTHAILQVGKAFKGAELANPPGGDADSGALLTDNSTVLREDARGLARAQGLHRGGPKPDIGAFELNPDGTTAQHLLPLNPEIDVQRPAATSIADGGTDNLGTLGTGTNVINYLIDNTAGSATLNISSVTVANATNAFSISALNLPLAIGDGFATNLQLQFTIGSNAAFSFDLDINNDDPDEDPYDIQVLGTGWVATTTEVRLNGATLEIEDTNGGDTDDQWTLTRSGANLVITSTDGGQIDMTGALDGGTGDGTASVEVPLASFTSISVMGQGGDDTLTVDYSGGSLIRPINYAGGGQTIGDTLVLTNGTVGTATYTFDNANDGSITLTGLSPVNYTGLEPIDSGVNASSVTLEYSTEGETITISDSGMAGRTRADSTMGETLTFPNPTASLTVRGGTVGADTIDLIGLGSGFSAALAVTTQGGEGDVLRIRGPVNTGGGGTVNLEGAEGIIFDMTGSLNSGGSPIFLSADSDFDGAGTFVSEGVANTITSGGGAIFITALDTEIGGAIDAGAGAVSISSFVPNHDVLLGTAEATEPTLDYAFNTDEDYNDLVVDSAGNLIVVGVFQGTEDFDPGPGVTNLTSSGLRDTMVLKFDLAGNILWAKKLGSFQDNIPFLVDLDSSGNVYVSGFFNSTLDVDPGPGTSNLVHNAGNDTYVVKLDANGDLVWGFAIAGSGQDSPAAMAVNNDRVFLSGFAVNTTADLDPGPGTQNYTAGAAAVTFLALYDTDGNYLDHGTIGGGAGTDVRSADAALDPSGNILLAIEIQGTFDVDFDAGVQNVGIAT